MKLRRINDFPIMLSENQDRHHRRRVIQRKSRIAKQLGWHVKFKGKLAKGKIHCSCYYCRTKSREIGWPKRDLVKLACMKEFNLLEQW